MIAAIANAIDAGGPLPLARAMALAADHYYANNEPFGPAGDFVTAPEISQLFGEVVASMLAISWLNAGKPPEIVLCELGPGRGTLMKDMLRTLDTVARDMLVAVRLHLVERSPRLRRLQQAALGHAHWHDSLKTVPAGVPLFLVANEFLDAMPLTQFERVHEGWALRRVAAGGWDLTLPANPHFVPDEVRDAPIGSIFERNFASEGLVSEVSQRLARDGGIALFVDYGYLGPAAGDTLQAIAGGTFADPLRTLGEADISAHVDFTAMARAATGAVRVWGPITQQEFLSRLFIRARAELLMNRAKTPEQSSAVETGFWRLIRDTEMGTLFKALALTGRGWPQPEGFPRIGE